MRLATDLALPADQPLPLTGTGLHVFPVKGAFDDLLDRNGAVWDAEVQAVGVMEVGGAPDNPTIGLLVRLPDGRQVLARIPLKLYLHAGSEIVAAASVPPPPRADLRAALRPARAK